MKKYSAIALGAVLAVAACKDNPVANPENVPPIEAISGALSRTTLQTLAIGVLAQDRVAVTSTFTFFTLSAILGRDAYRIDASEPRYVTETLGGQADPSSFAGGGGWAAFYTAIRAATSLIEAIPGADASLSEPQKNAALGFIKTIKALDYMRLIELRDSVGIPIQSSDIAEVAPIRCKPAVYAYIAALLDSGLADLTAAGATTTVTFRLPSGFTNFGRNYGTVSNIILFNRGLKGKLDFYRALNRQAPQPALFATAIAELTQALGAAPGAVPATHFSWGPYYVFVVGGSEATPNPISDSRIGLNPLVKDSVQAGDTRASKIVSRSTLTFVQGAAAVQTNITYSGAVSSAANQARPVGILRDEELVLLRAQAEIEAGQFADATADINSVRTNYGLAAIPTITTVTEGRSRVLYEKRYSLLFEGDQRLVDLRSYGYLNNTYLRRELPTDPFNAGFPIPKTESDPRGGNIACQP